MRNFYKWVKRALNYIGYTFTLDQLVGHLFSSLLTIVSTVLVDMQIISKWWLVCLLLPLTLSFRSMLFRWKVYKSHSRWAAKLGELPSNAKVMELSDAWSSDRTWLLALPCAILFLLLSWWLVPPTIFLILDTLNR